jgi:Yip1 domain
MSQLHLRSEIWDTFTHSRMSVLRMFVFYAVPLSVIPPAMIYFAGTMYGGHLLPVLSSMQLQTIGIVFYIAELVMTFLVATVIRSLGDVVDIKPAYEDAYKLAVVVPTPLWIAPIFLFIPSFMLNLAIGAAALILSGMLIFYNVPSILKVEEEGHAILLSGSILAVGMVAWAALMLLTFLSWSFITSTLPLLI